MNESNEIRLEGGITSVGKLTSGKNNSLVLYFGITNSSRFRDGSGETREKTRLFDCVLFGNIAKENEPKITKGRKVLIIGEMDQNDCGGMRKHSIIVKEIKYLEK